MQIDCRWVEIGLRCLGGNRLKMGASRLRVGANWLKVGVNRLKVKYLNKLINCYMILYFLD